MQSGQAIRLAVAAGGVLFAVLRNQYRATVREISFRLNQLPYDIRVSFIAGHDQWRVVRYLAR